jgi:hypothetical protein
MKSTILTLCFVFSLIQVSSCDNDGQTNNVNSLNNLNNLNNTNHPELCDNQLDDDADQLTDCDDPDCATTPGCTTGECGDGILHDQEECDGANLNGKTCADFNFESGELACGTYCTFVYMGCEGVSPSCEAAADDLTTEMYSEAGRSCSATVRLDYLTYELIGFQLSCGGYGGLDEPAARAAAERDTGIGGDAVLVNADDHSDNWVFFDATGATALVSAYTGNVVFGGTWGGAVPGDLTWPTTWREAQLLAGGCPPSGRIPTSRGFDLSDDAAPLSGAEVDLALAAVGETALLAGFWQGGYVFDATVLLYPRSLDPLDEGTAEWIVILGGGWLE